MTNLPVFDDAEILAARGPKNQVDPTRPYAFLHETEHASTGQIVDVNTIFLTNRECPFRCLMCDLWKNTTDSRVPVGAIPAQLDYALERLPAAAHIKLYNSGNFFDAQAIPREDRPAIAERVGGFANVIVENHPRLCGSDCPRFRDLTGTDLEIAIGLETVHPQVLPRLNKQMTCESFHAAAQFLNHESISVRAFILLRPPFLSEAEGVEWAVRSIRFAFDCGATCCAVIPTRGGNGIMEQLSANELFVTPQLGSLEEVLQRGLELDAGRVFVDLWDAAQLTAADCCREQRIERLNQGNLSQRLSPFVTCPQCTP